MAKHEYGRRHWLGKIFRQSLADPFHGLALLDHDDPALCHHGIGARLVKDILLCDIDAVDHVQIEVAFGLSKRVRHDVITNLVDIITLVSHQDIDRSKLACLQVPHD